jgi:GTP-binding protein
VAFHREKYVAAGGPDGGDGGRGGNIVFTVDENMSTLMDFRYKRKYVAGNGANGMGKRCYGKDGDTLYIKVPRGTIVRDTETGAIMHDMSDGEDWIAAKGGRGGWGNMHFATPTRQAPNFAKPGTKTEIHAFILELKTIADVGLMGYPNVGKSTLLSAVTSAKPKIGNYHFTTLTPNLGIVRRHGEDIVLADIPGLVEGASEGVGLGHDFLRHVDRTRLLLHLVDISGMEARDPVEDYEQINHELENYGDLANSPQILVCNKMDLPGAEENLERMKEHVKDQGIPVFAISAAAHQGLDALLDCVEEKLRDLPPIQHYEPEMVVEEAAETDSFHIEMDGDVYVVAGSAMERLLDSVNFDDDESVNWFHRSLRRLGVIDALRQNGAGEGDTVRIADIEFDFID